MLLSVAVSGCAVFPTAGPLVKNIEDEYRSGTVRPFELVEVNTKSIEVLRRRVEPGLSQSFGAEGRHVPEIVIGVGDSLALTIWEVGSESLFSASSAGGAMQAGSGGGSRAATIPEQVVDTDGSITVPFVGPVKVAGLTPQKVQSQIQAQLQGKAAKPQVLVGIARNNSNTITVVGEVTGGARVPLSARGDHVLDVIASVGGVKTAVHESTIKLTRDNRSVSVPLSRVIDDPAENIYVRPGDVMAVTRRPQTFTALGATGRNTQIAFDASDVTLVEAIAKAGGLLDNRADPRGVFLFRQEPRDLVRQLAASADEMPLNEGSVPVIYQLDLSMAGSYFLAQNFTLRDRDILYVSAARANELEKFLQLIGLITQPAINAAIVTSASQN